MKVASQKSKQIINYYLFHKKIDFIFNFGTNPLYKSPEKNFFNSGNNILEKFYIIDINWINSWKKYSNYNSAITYLEKIENKFN